MPTFFAKTIEYGDKRRKILITTLFAKPHADPGHAAKFAMALISALLKEVSATTYIKQMIEKVGERPREFLLRADNICVIGRRAFKRVIRSEQN